MDIEQNIALAKAQLAQFSGVQSEREWQFEHSDGSAVVYEERLDAFGRSPRILVAIHSRPDDQGNPTTATFLPWSTDAFPTDIDEVPHEQILDYLDAQQGPLRGVVEEATAVQTQADALHATSYAHRNHRLALRALSDARTERTRFARVTGEGDTVRFESEGGHSITYRQGDGDHAVAEVVVYTQPAGDLATSPVEATADHRSVVRLPRVSWNPTNIRRIQAHRELRQALEARQRELEQAWQAAIDGE